MESRPGCFLESAEEKWQKPVMEKLIADGTVKDWGFLATGLHKEGGYTHATWFSTKNHADTAKVWAAYEAHGKKVGGSDDASDKALAKLEKGHMDRMIRDMHVHATPGRFEDATFYQWSVTVDVDSGDDFEQFWKDEIQPVHEKLLADGVVIAYGYYTQEIVTDNPGERGSWVIFKDISGMDKMEAAFAENRKDWSKTQGKLWWSGRYAITCRSLRLRSRLPVRAVENAPNLLLELRRLSHDDIPDDRHVDAKVLVNQD